jgi:hypothetical protein
VVRHQRHPSVQAGQWRRALEKEQHALR